MARDSQMVWSCPAADPRALLGYRCPELWWSLDETPAPGVRFCGNCRKRV